VAACRVVLCCQECPVVDVHSWQHNTTQHGMLPQNQLE